MQDINEVIEMYPKERDSEVLRRDKIRPKKGEHRHMNIPIDIFFL